MDQFHGRSLTNPRGGRRRRNRDKRKYECGGYFSAPKLAEESVSEKRRMRGSGFKVKPKGVSHANVIVDKGRAVKAKITKVISTPDNRNYARQGKITKGAVIGTEAGDSVVISRPAQDGVVNARLLKG